MRNHSGNIPAVVRGGAWRFTLVPAVVLLGAFATSALATGDAADRGGKEVVQATCGACHATGKDGAPRIGDKAAWSKLAARGLTSLTQSALAGIRKMPAHGGSATTSDVEISRAITYMVNQSGFRWVEPVGKPVPAAKPVEPKERSGQQIVHTQCDKCHHDGVAGAPMIGDRDAWVKRLNRGLDEVVRSAFNGHGPMPARGGLADITVNEMRNAIIYMFNPASASMVAPVAVAAPSQDPFHKVVGNTEIFFGIASAEAIRGAQKKQSTPSLSAVPDGANFYHVNVSLRDRITKVVVTNAQVEARVEDPAQRGESRPLEVIAINKAISYGAFFQLPTRGRYTVTVKIQRPDATQAGEARFEYSRD